MSVEDTKISNHEKELCTRKFIDSDLKICNKSLLESYIGKLRNVYQTKMNLNVFFYRSNYILKSNTSELLKFFKIFWFKKKT